MSSPTTELQACLEPGEQLLWSGSPRGGIRFRSQDIFMIPFSIAWCGFAVFWTVTATSHGAPAFFTLWGMMFICIGLFFVFGRFITDMMIRQNTAYGVTNHRILILSGLFSKQFRSLNLRAIPETSMTVHSDGTGTILFGYSPFPAAIAHRGWPGAGRILPASFEFIDRPQEVHRLVLAQQRNG